MDRKSMRNVHAPTLFENHFTPDVTTEVHCFSNESKVAKTDGLLCNTSDYVGQFISSPGFLHMNKLYRLA